MGGKTMGIISIVLGAILVVTGVGTFAGIMLIAGGIYSLAFAPKTPDQEAAAAQELTIAPASVGHPVPVVFGIVRLTPNFMNYSLDHFKAVEQFADPPGGKGGDQPAQSTGFEYYLKWEYGLCMGPIDAIGQVYSMPGEIKMIDTDDFTLFSGDYVDLTLDEDKQGGTARVYKGASNQTRVASGDVYQPQGMNYRNVAWVLMGVGAVGANGFLMGSMPQPNTYQFMVRRLPKCIRDDDTTVAIPTRGSLNVSDYSYWEANPAAIIYEMLTNKVWGRGLSSDIIDEASFIATGEFFATNRLGMSFKVDAQEPIGDVLEAIRRHLKTILTWDGEVYKIKTLLDPDTTHEFIQTLRSDEISDLQITRPLWENVINELRAEYTSKDRSFRTDMVHAQNLAAKEAMSGWVTSDRLQLNGFSDPEVIGQQLNRILSELSYPLMTATFEMNRYKSQIEVGDCLRIIWSEFNDTAITAYFIALNIEDGASDSENIKVTAVEDTLLCPVSGEETTVTLPTTYPWQLMSNPTGADTNLHTPPSPVTEEITPIMAFEFPPLATGGDQAMTLLIGEKTNTQMIGAECMWSKNGTGYTVMGTSTAFAVTGVLNDAITSLGYTDRSAGYEIQMTDVGKKAALLSVVTVVEPTDDLETVTQSYTNYVIIGNEIMQVGYFEDGGTDLVIMRNIVRGVFGSPIETHAAADEVFFIASKVPGFPTNDLPEDTDLWFKAYPVGLWASVFANGTAFQLPDTTWHGKGRRPMAPEFYAYTESVGRHYFSVRPRFSKKGAGVNPFYETLKTPVTVNDEGIGLAYLEVDATNTPLTSWLRTPPEITWFPGQADGIGGYLRFDVLLDSSTKLVRIYTLRNGRSSYDFIEVPI